MFARNLTARDFLKIESCNALENCQRLTPDDRMAQALFARSVRNVFFTATQPNGTSLQAPLVPGGLCQTPTFSDPIIITDVLSMTDYQQQANTTFNASRFLLQLTEYGLEVSYGQDFFGLSFMAGFTGFAPAEFITKHEKNRSTALDLVGGGAVRNIDTEDKWVGFIPRLLRPYEYLQAQWRMLVAEAAIDVNVSLTPQLGFRGVRVLANDDPYVAPDGTAKTDLCNFISGNTFPETYYLTIKIPNANFPALGASPLIVTTVPSDKPLLILGAASNIEGAQADLWDDSKYYRFTVRDSRIGGAGGSVYSAVPLNLWAPDTDFRNVGIFNMWPVPHLLDRNANLRVVITNGLQPSQGTFQQPIKTRSNQPGYITFICRPA